MNWVTADPKSRVRAHIFNRLVYTRIGGGVCAAAPFPGKFCAMWNVVVLHNVTPQFIEG